MGMQEIQGYARLEAPPSVQHCTSRTASPQERVQLAVIRTERVPLRITGVAIRLAP